MLDEYYDSSDKRISDGREKRSACRMSLRKVLVFSHITLSLEFGKVFFVPQCLQLPMLSRPLGVPIIQWWTHFFFVFLTFTVLTGVFA
ncbi:MAG: hypothetical protein CL792_01710 [Chloroflexi bacterium]|nr:hypothetical protein [Chloroflexota bacterium]